MEERLCSNCGSPSERCLNCNHHNSRANWTPKPEKKENNNSLYYAAGCASMGQGCGCATIIIAVLIGLAISEYFPQVLAVIEKFAK